jgi:hypothetical protein
MALVHERTVLTERPPLVGEVSANFYTQRERERERERESGRERGCHIVSAMDPHGRIIGFLDRIPTALKDINEVQKVGMGCKGLQSSTTLTMMLNKVTCIINKRIKK